MHRAPSVVFPVGSCVFQGALLLLLGLSGATVLAGWWWLSVAPMSIWPGIGGGMGMLLWLGLAWRSWHAAPVGRLRWRAEERLSLGAAPGCWYWGDLMAGQDTLLQSVEPVWDWQRVMLLRVRRRDAITHWIWVERARDPRHWDDLRRALMPMRG